MLRRTLRVVVALAALLALVAAGGAVYVRGQLRGSLPQLEGERPLEGLAAPVRVDRDSLGIPTIRGASREDVARATGFLHAQDRFFQMDLARRRAAGELAALVGPLALPADRPIRIHRFRTQAKDAAALLPPDQRALLDAYTAGVNAGLAAFATPPFEYLLLGQEPAPWRPEDTLLVILSMFITLQDADGEYESTLATMRDVLPEPMFEFLAPGGSEWDTPLIGEAFPVPPVPGPEIYDLRSRRRRLPTPDLDLPNGDDASRDRRQRFGVGDWALGIGEWDSGFGNWTLRASESAAVGSNNFAVSGALTPDGAALLANDMHLGIRVPNTWYRAAFEWPDPEDTAAPNRLIGLTLPGVPAMVAGSNTYIAWGFTNTYADWNDLVLLETDRSRPGEYLTPGGWRRFERFEEVIEVAGADPERLDVLWTVWGPVIDRDHQRRRRALRWVAHSTERLATSLTQFERARTIEEAFDEANGLGVPGQNLLVAGRDGRIGWTVYGSIPRRVGLDGRLPQSWANGSRGWDGWLRDDEYPRIIDPPDGRLWTANARVVDGEMLARLGDGGFEIGSRARIIRNRLYAQERFTAVDLLGIQLDTSADFLARWRDLMMRTLAGSATEGRADRAELLRVLTDRWSGRADPDSAAYRFTRAFRDEASDRVIAFVLAECYEADRDFDYRNVRRREAAIWRLVTEQPFHLLDPRYGSWQELLLAAVDAALETATAGRRGPLHERRWSEMNRTAYQHPLSGAIPFGDRWLDMPRGEMPGDLYTPRVHWGAIGASERMVVSPGREDTGILHMPTGQSGHPLSPFYASSHDAWVRGEPTPFLPGPAQHTLRLVP